MNRMVGILLVVLMAACSQKPAPQPAPELRAEKLGENPTDSTAVVGISSERAKAADIEMRLAGAAVIRETLTFYGTIRPNAEREQTVRARYSGVVRTVTKRPGDSVKAGETLLTIESNDSLEPYAIRAPMNGSVLERNVNPGESVDANSGLMRIADLSTVWAEFAVFARDLGRVRRGMSVGIRAGDTDVIGTTQLTYVAPTGHADSQSVVARAVLTNAGGQWVAGQFVTGEVVVSEVKAAVSVAPSALQTLKDGPAVFVQSAQGFEPRVVAIGHRDREAVEILKGVSAGEKYAAKNSYLIKADLLKGEAQEE